MSPQKRIRASNYTQQEKDLLLDCIKPFIHIIECGETTKKSNEKKEQAWLAVERNFNVHNETQRDAKSLRNNYMHLKMLVKREVVSSLDPETQKTMHPSCLKLLAMLGGHQVEPMINLYDSSSEYLHNTNTNSSSMNCDPVEVDEELTRLKKEKYIKKNLLLDKQIQIAELDLQLKKSQLKYGEARLKLLLDNKLQ